MCGEVADVLQVEHPIGELQTLDAAHRVHAGGHRAVGVEVLDAPRAVIVAGDEVVRPHVAVVGGVENTGLAGRHHDAAHDLEILWIDRSAEHPGLEPGHARLFLTARDMAQDDLEGGVAIDVVVAHAALDQVAVRTAEDDVVGLAGGHQAGRVRWHCAAAEEFAEPADLVDVLLGQDVSTAVRIGGISCRTASTQHVGLVPSGETFDVHEPGAHVLHLERLEHRDVQVGLAGERIVLVGDPVEAEHAGVTVDAVVQHDVVSAFGVVVVITTPAVEHLVAAVRVGHQREGVVALHEVVAPGTFQPVGVLVAGEDVVGVAAADEVGLTAGEGLRDLVAVQDEVGTGATEDEVEAGASVHSVVARTGVDRVVTEDVGDRVVTVSAVEDVVAHPAFDAVVALVTPHRVVAIPAGDVVVTRRGVDHDVFDAVVAVARAALDEQLVRPGRRVGLEVDHDVGVGEDVRVQVVRIRVAQHELREGVVLELVHDVQTLRTGEVVEAVGVLQGLQVLLEHVVEARAEQTAEDHPVLGESADPEVDVVEPGLGGRRVHERRVGSSGCSCAALVGHGRRALERRVDAVGGDEVDDRATVLHRQAEVLPAVVGLQVGVERLRVERGAGLLQGRHAGVTPGRC